MLIERAPQNAALFAAVTALMPAVDPARVTAPLRRLLAELIGAVDTGADTAETTTPPARDATDGAAGHSTDSSPGKAAPSVARRTTRQAPERHATRGVGRPAMTSAQWLTLRAAVRQRHPSNAGLAEALGAAFATTEGVMGRKSPPSIAIQQRLRALLASAGSGAGKTTAHVGPRTAQDGAEAPPAAPAPGNGSGPALPQPAANGQAAKAAAEEARALAAKLRAKRRPLPLTSTTLAATIGCTADELDDALHARVVPPLAAERLAAWAAG